MSDFFGSIWWLIVTLGLLITFHEYGHYVVARRLGVKVLRFSVGFGRALWSRVGRDGTEYVVAAIPLGGYVKMLDEREGDVDPAEAHRAFNRKPVLSRIAIVAAGPLFNIVFALAACWLMFVVGKADFQPIVGRVDGVALESGFRPGDRLTRVGDDAISTWTDAAMLLARHALDREPVAVGVVAADGAATERVLQVQRLASDGEPASPQQLGLYPKQFLLPPVVGEITPGSPAERAGLEVGDRVVAVGTEPVTWHDDVPALVQRFGAGGQAIDLTVQRGTDQLRLSVTPEFSKEANRLLIGFAARRVAADYDTVRQFGPVEAVGVAFQETWRMSREILKLLKLMIVGKASVKNLAGPITIAQYANQSAQLGVAWFLSFLAMLSMTLAIMNLLPIPILDGGHLLYYLIELVKGSPVSERVVAAGQYVGLGLLAMLIGLAIYNDILRNV
jgi:regulator of sigma E protease